MMPYRTSAEPHVHPSDDPELTPNSKWIPKWDVDDYQKNITVVLVGVVGERVTYYFDLGEGSPSPMFRWTVATNTFKEVYKRVG